MGDNVVEIIVRAIDQFSDTLDKIGQKGGSMTDRLTANCKAIGVAAAAAGAGVEYMARQQGQLSEATDKLSISSGLTADELRDIAREVSGYGDSLKDTIAIMQLGSESGLRSGEALKEYAGFWDMVSDASGEAGDVLAKGANALEAFGIGAENSADAGDAFGFMLNETKYSMEEFMTTTGRVAGSLEKFHLNVDQLAVILDKLEERGIRGKKAISMINDAAGESKNIAELEKNLGLLPGTLDNASAATEGYSEKLADMARAHEENLTPIQKFQSALSELQFQYGETIQAAANFAPALILTGPALKGIGELRTAIAAEGGAAAIAASSSASLSASFSSLFASSSLLWPVLLLVGSALAISYLGDKYTEYQHQRMTDIIEGMTDAERKEYQQKLKNIELYGESAPLIEQEIEAQLNATGVTLDYVDANEQAYESEEIRIQKMLEAGKTYDEFGNQIKDVGKIQTTTAQEIKQAVEEATSATKEAYLGLIDSLVAGGHSMEDAKKIADIAFPGMANTVTVSGLKSEKAVQGLIAELQALGYSFEEAERIARASMGGVCTSCEGAVQKLNMYVDGVKQTVTTIGSGKEATDLIWDKEKGIWRRAYQTSTGNYTTDQKLAQAKAGGAPISPSGLAYKWDAEHNEYSTVYDAAGNYVGEGSQYSQGKIFTEGYGGSYGTTPSGKNIGKLINDGSYKAIGTGGSGDTVYQLTREEWESYQQAGVQLVGPAPGSDPFGGDSYYDYLDPNVFPQTYTPPASSPSLDMSTGGAGSPILYTPSSPPQSTQGGTTLTLNNPVFLGDRTSARQVVRALDRATTSESIRRGVI